MGTSTEGIVVVCVCIKNDIFREAIKTFVRVQAAKRLAALGGTAPAMQTIP